MKSLVLGNRAILYVMAKSLPSDGGEVCDDVITSLLGDEVRDRHILTSF